MGKTRKALSPSNTGEIVLAAIKKLTKNTGWTARTIIKFIKMEYELDDSNISRKVSRALKRGIRLGLLQMERGRYRLHNMSHLARLVGDRRKECKQTKRQQREKPLQLRSVTPSSKRVCRGKRRSRRH